MTTLQSLSSAQLRNILSIKEKIESLQAELDALNGGAVEAPAKTPGKRTMSASAKARIAAAQKARWAKLRSGKTAAAHPAAGPRKRRKMSAAAKAKIAAAARARWARVRAEGKKSL